MVYTAKRSSRKRKRRQKMLDNLIRLGLGITIVLIILIVILLFKRCSDNKDETDKSNRYIETTITTTETTKTNGDDETTSSVDETNNPQETSSVDPNGDLHSYYGDEITKDGQMIVCLDAGHGGIDGGCTTADESRLEKNDALVLCKAIKTELEALGVKVYMTREDDSDLVLENRALYANQVKADVLLSVHRNSYEADPNVHGIEAWINSSSPANSTVLSTSILTALESVGVTRNRGIRVGTQGNAATDYAINSISSMPSLILEMGFITSPEDNANLDAKNSAYAKAIAEAVVAFIKTQE